MHDEPRYAYHLVEHWDDIALKGHCLNLSLVHDPHQESEKWLAFQKVVSMIQVGHLLGLLGGSQDLTIGVKHYWGTLLAGLKVLDESCA